MVRSAFAGGGRAICSQGSCTHDPVCCMVHSHDVGTSFSLPFSSIRHSKAVYIQLLAHVQALWVRIIPGDVAAGASRAVFVGLEGV